MVSFLTIPIKNKKNQKYTIAGQISLILMKVNLHLIDIHLPCAVKRNYSNKIVGKRFQL